MKKSVATPHCTLCLLGVGCVLVLYAVHPPVTVNHLQTHRERRRLTGMAPSMLRRLALAGMVALLVGSAEISESAQDLAEGAAFIVSVPVLGKALAA